MRKKTSWFSRVHPVRPAINITSPNFTSTVSAWADGQHGEGTPDPDAIGILACGGR